MLDQTTKNEAPLLIGLFFNCQINVSQEWQFPSFALPLFQRQKQCSITQFNLIS
jgi:hypothetical protein